MTYLECLISEVTPVFLATPDTGDTGDQVLTLVTLFRSVDTGTGQRSLVTPPAPHY